MSERRAENILEVEKIYLCNSTWKLTPTQLNTFSSYVSNVFSLQSMCVCFPITCRLVMKAKRTVWTHVLQVWVLYILWRCNSIIFFREAENCVLFKLQTTESWKYSHTSWSGSHLIKVIMNVEIYMMADRHPVQNSRLWTWLKLFNLSFQEEGIKIIILIIICFYCTQVLV
jgi:hypothetical protein